MKQENHSNTIFKNLVDSNNMLKELCKSVEPVGTKPGTMYGLRKVHKQVVPILNPLTKNKYTAKDSFQFAE